MQIFRKNSIRIETEDNTNENFENNNEKILGKIHIFNILKSFICNGNKDKLISLCNMIITEDMCVERILERFYSLGNIYKLIKDKDKEKDSLCIDTDMRFVNINSIVNDVINQITISNSKDYKEQKT